MQRSISYIPIQLPDTYLTLYGRNDFIDKVIRLEVATRVTFPVTLVLKGVCGHQKAELTCKTNHGRHVGS